MTKRTNIIRKVLLTGAIVATAAIHAPLFYDVEEGEEVNAIAFEIQPPLRLNSLPTEPLPWKGKYKKTVRKTFRYVNRNCIYMFDHHQYGDAFVEKWNDCLSTAVNYEDGKGRGDCEDYMLAYYNILSRKFPEYKSSFYFMHVDLGDLNDGVTHAVLFIHTTDGLKVLDSAHTDKNWEQDYKGLTERGYFTKIYGQMYYDTDTDKVIGYDLAWTDPTTLKK